MLQSLVLALKIVLFVTLVLCMVFFCMGFQHTLLTRLGRRPRPGEEGGEDMLLGPVWRRLAANRYVRGWFFFAIMFACGLALLVIERLVPGSVV